MSKPHTSRRVQRALQSKYVAEALRPHLVAIASGDKDWAPEPYEKAVALMRYMKEVNSLSIIEKIAAAVALQWVRGGKPELARLTHRILNNIGSLSSKQLAQLAAVESIPTKLEEVCCAFAQTCFSKKHCKTLLKVLLKMAKKNRAAVLRILDGRIDSFLERVEVSIQFSKGYALASTFIEFANELQAYQEEFYACAKRLVQGLCSSVEEEGNIGPFSAIAHLSMYAAPEGIIWLRRCIYAPPDSAQRFIDYGSAAIKALEKAGYWSEDYSQALSLELFKGGRRARIARDVLSRANCNEERLQFVQMLPLTAVA